MKRKTKTIMLMITILAMLSMTGCGKKEAAETVAEVQAPAEAVEEEAEAVAEEAVTEEPEEEIVEEVAEIEDEPFGDDEPIGDLDDAPKGISVEFMEEYTLGGDIMPLDDISLVIDQLNILFPGGWTYQGNTAKRGYEYFATTGEFDYYLYPMVQKHEVYQSEIDYVYEENAQYILQVEFDTLGEGVNYEPTIRAGIYNKSTGMLLLLDIKCKMSDGCYEYPSYGLFKDYLDANIALIKSQLGM